MYINICIYNIIARTTTSLGIYTPIVRDVEGTELRATSSPCILYTYILLCMYFYNVYRYDFVYVYFWCT